jgi:hypothetical protein
MGYLEDKLFGPLGKDYCNVLRHFAGWSNINDIDFTTTTYLMLFTKDKKTFGVKGNQRVRRIHDLPRYIFPQQTAV